MGILPSRASIHLESKLIQLRMIGGNAIHLEFIVRDAPAIAFPISLQFGTAEAESLVAVVGHPLPVMALEQLGQVP
jgi:hypothetical protein